MRKIQGLAALALICLLSIGSTAWAGDFPHQYGIELRGGYGIYLDNTDPNNFAKDFFGTSGYTQKEYNKSQGALGGGISVLYKTEEYFAFHVGLNVLSSDSATAIAVNNANQAQYGRIFTSAVELFVTANYYWNISDRLNLQFGAGPAFYLASLDRESTAGADALYGDSFYGAHGRSFGVLGTVGAELFLSDAIALRLGGGFRYAAVSRFKFFREIQDANGTHKEGEIAYWPESYNTFETNYSGPFAEVGLRIYFEPANAWK
ncbi:MAG: outer membrane beta-barrel protein [bacterium]|nr:outer membrane beta-barrel protein [bacterium]